MKMLLDTHIVLCAIADTDKLSAKVIELLELKDNEVFYSVASVWEVAIKHKIRPEQMPISEEALWRGLCYECVRKRYLEDLWTDCMTVSWKDGKHA